MVGNPTAFAAVKVDGSVVTWGNAVSGGDSRGVAEQLSSGVQTVVGTRTAFAAVKVDGSVVTWGSKSDSIPSNVVGPGNYSRRRRLGSTRLHDDRVG